MDSPSIYVGTYAAYNSGSLKGKWFDLEDFADADEFYEAIAEFHSNPDNDDSRTAPEDDPEFMFQDWEGIPEGMIGESWLDPDLWEKWIDLDEDDRELLQVYCDNVRGDVDIDAVRDAFLGKFNSEADWAAEYWEESGLLSHIPENLQFYIDYEAYARDCRLGGDITFVCHDGDVWVFSNH